MIHAGKIDLRFCRGLGTTPISRTIPSTMPLPYVAEASTVHGDFPQLAAGHAGFDVGTASHNKGYILAF